MDKEINHIPVLLEECLELLKIEPGQTFLDGTVGCGGHSLSIAKRLGKDGTLIGIDLDENALNCARKKISKLPCNLHLIQGNFKDMKQHCETLGIEALDGILLDLGVSSLALDDSSRGFSFSMDGPLDMRFNQSAGVSAKDFIEQSSEEELQKIFREYGEERHSRHYARIISKYTEQNTIDNTLQLGELIRNNTPQKWRKGKKINPATKVFQSLRIVVNKEISNLKAALPVALDLLAKGGRLAVISFHSLEDRIVKHYFQTEARDCICPPAFPICVCNHKSRIKILTRSPIRAGKNEKTNNPRARSALLRVVEKKEDNEREVKNKL